MRNLLACASIIVVVGFASAAAAQPASPKPQYSVEDVQRALGATPAPAPAAPGQPAQAQGDCDAGLVPDAEGNCIPSKGATRGFSLPSRGAAQGAGQPAGQRAPQSSGARARTTAAIEAPPAAPKRPYDLLLTFANNSATLTPQAMANAGVFAEALQTSALTGARFEIAGHTNAVGSRESNMELSKNRAAAVVAYLEAKGVPAGQLQATAYGFDRPLNKADPKAAENRRVEARRLN
jgi:outer membrane protein OmpA-like peptidoglycan-associated protein